MTLVMTLLVRDEADIVATQLRYHYAAGVDFVIATDHHSVDGTREILDEYESLGLCRVLGPPTGDLTGRQGELVTRMARLAALEHGADWVLNSDADEFWWPRCGSLKDVLSATPRQFGAVRGLMRHFVPRPDGPEPLLERMIARHPGMVSRDHPYHFQVKIAHRGTGDVQVARGNHDARGTGLALLRQWIPIEVLHFPIRSRQQMERKYRRRNLFMASHIDAVAGSIDARGADDVFAEYLVDDERLAVGLAAGTLGIDVRLRDVVRQIESQRSTVETPFEAESALSAERAFISDAALFMETDASVLLRGRVDALDVRVTAAGGVKL